MTSAQKKAFMDKALAGNARLQVTVVRPMDLLRQLPKDRPMTGREKTERWAERMDRRNGGDGL